MRSIGIPGAAATVLLLAVGTTSADEILFNNGDRLTGKILKVDGGKMTIKTAHLGEVTAEIKDVKTFTTDEPVEIRTKGGDRITAKAAAADPGQVRADSRQVSLEQVKYVNFSEAWSGALVAGAMFARGNTFADQLNVSFDLARRTERDRWTFTGGYNFGRQRTPDSGEKTTTTDNWFATGKYDYFVNEKLYAFGGLRYEHDRIAGLDVRLVPSAGLGYLWLDTPDLKFDTEAGLAYVWEKFDDGDSEGALSARLAYHYKNNIYGDKVAAFHNLEFYPSVEELGDFLLITDVGLRAALTERMFAEYKFEWRYDATPAEDAEKNDLRHVVGVGWRF
jgi:putative salt-induced outer membrane protein YdiY